MKMPPGPGFRNWQATGKYVLIEHVFPPSLVFLFIVLYVDNRILFEVGNLSYRAAVSNSASHQEGKLLLFYKCLLLYHIYKLYIIMQFRSVCRNMKQTL
jgi:hypothetical protein